MKKFVVCFLSLFLVFCSYSYSRAQVYVDPYTGVYQFDSNQHLNVRSYYGLRLGYEFNSFGIETMFGYIPTETDFPNVWNNNVKVFRYGVDFLYNFNFHERWVPYIIVGVGRTSMHNPESGMREYSCNLFDYGIGVRYLVNSNIALRMDFREDNFWRGDDFNHNQEYTFGITFYFGERSNFNNCNCPEIKLIPLVSAHFKYNSSKITECGERILDENISMLKDHSDLKIEIHGYASPDGSKDYNLKLSKRRALSVKKYMIEQGVSEDRIIAIGKGEIETDKILDINSKEAKNARRVIFKVKK